MVSWFSERVARGSVAIQGPKALAGMGGLAVGAGTGGAGGCEFRYEGGEEVRGGDAGILLSFRMSETICQIEHGATSPDARFAGFEFLLGGVAPIG